MYFDLNRNEYPDEYGYELLLKSRFYCNYIERTVFKPLKWKTPDFDRISIKFTDNPNNIIEVNSFKVLCIRIKFDKKIYEQFINKNIADYFIIHFEKTLNIIKENGIKLPVEEIKKANKEFILNNYTNRWLYKKKTNRNLKIEAYLYCELTEKQFTLTLKITQSGNIIYDKILLELAPDPVAYHYRFKDIIITDNKLTISSKISDENLIGLDLKEYINE